jgi:hypothetical protein
METRIFTEAKENPQIEEKEKETETDREITSNSSDSTDLDEFPNIRPLPPRHPHSAVHPYCSASSSCPFPRQFWHAPR